MNEKLNTSILGWKQFISAFWISFDIILRFAFEKWCKNPPPLEIRSSNFFLLITFYILKLH